VSGSVALDAPTHGRCQQGLPGSFVVIALMAVYLVATLRNKERKSNLTFF